MRRLLRRWLELQASYDFLGDGVQKETLAGETHGPESRSAVCAGTIQTSAESREEATRFPATMDFLNAGAEC